MRPLSNFVTPLRKIDMSTKTNSRTLRNCTDDEPIFVLRAQDKTACDVVQKWIDINAGRLGFSHPKILTAVKTRNEMADWQPQKLPD